MIARLAYGDHTVIDLNRYKLDTTFYTDHLVHRVQISQGLAPFSTRLALFGIPLVPFSTRLAQPKKTWKKVKQIGEGGFGSVWLEKEVSTGDLRAVKKIYREKNRNFDREIRALVQMESHRDLFVQFLGWYEDGRDFIFIAMEYHENGDLGGYLKTFRSKARSEVKEITGQLLKGLVALHQNHICHRDLKPNNVLIACLSPIQVKLVDFGTSKSTVDTALRTRCGTSGYMAPELLGLVPRENGPYTTALDIWSLGCVIYEILTSETPFLGKLVDLDTTMSGCFVPDTPEIDMHLFSQFCSGNIGLPVECLRASGAGENGVNFLRKLLVANPTFRVSAIDALNSRWLFELPDELYQEDGSDILRGQFRSLELRFDAQTMDSLIAQCKERLPSLVSTAVRMGHTLVVELLLQTVEHLHFCSGKIINYDAAEGDLRSAAERGHLNIVRLLLERGTDANATGDQGQTALHEAAKNGRLEIVRLLLENGANINLTDYRGRTALHEAAKYGYLGVVRLLLENSAGVDPTALCEAAKYGHLEVVRLLLENGADANITGDWGQTALREAAKHRHLEVVRLLLENGADANITGGWDPTALREAVGNGDPQVVRLLLENGADASPIALREAEKYGHLEVVTLLLDNGADSNITTNSHITDCQGQTALREATERTSRGSQTSLRRLYGYQFLGSYSLSRSTEDKEFRDSQATLGKVRVQSVIGVGQPT